MVGGVGGGGWGGGREVCEWQGREQDGKGASRHSGPHSWHTWGPVCAEQGQKLRLEVPHRLRVPSSLLLHANALDELRGLHAKTRQRVTTQTYDDHPHGWSVPQHPRLDHMPVARSERILQQQQLQRKQQRSWPQASAKAARADFFTHTYLPLGRLWALGSKQLDESRQGGDLSTVDQTRQDACVQVGHTGGSSATPSRPRTRSPCTPDAAATHALALDATPHGARPGSAHAVVQEYGRAPRSWRGSCGPGDCRASSG